MQTLLKLCFLIAIATCVESTSIEEDSKPLSEYGDLFEGKTVRNPEEGDLFEGKTVRNPEEGDFFEGKTVRNPEEGDLFEGDILGPIPALTRAGLLSPARRWPSATIPYQFVSTFPSSYRTVFQSAINYIAGRTCIRFKPRYTEYSYVEVNQVNGCSAHVGRIGGRQYISLANGCNYLGTIVHEMMHTIGFFHEQSRTDRDKYVTINWGNIEPGREGAFRSYDTSYISPFGVAYDYSSIMHYGSKYFSKNGLDTIVPKQAGAIIGNRDTMSNSDIWKINNMYCPGTQGVSIKSHYNAQYLDVSTGIVYEGQDLVTSAWGNNNTQRWTIDWYAFFDPARGAKIWTWAQDGGTVKTIHERQANTVLTLWGDIGGLSQNWIGIRIGTTGSTYTIKNKMSGRCMSNNGASKATCAPCNSSNLRQRWEIYKAYPN
ncbi:zinc metalloproteinase nas-4 [Folsomia candida]|uniref:zinc metalloproteinase nas-4 n=1 Tax=Folsomia candida TaxID=158441 RepID=UPI000B8FF047|nr:zinc metalloproteinase nas-4 [Folsomia candida]